RGPPAIDRIELQPALPHAVGSLGAPHEDAVLRALHGLDGRGMLANELRHGIHLPPGSARKTSCITTASVRRKRNLHASGGGPDGSPRVRYFPPAVGTRPGPDDGGSTQAPW